VSERIIVLKFGSSVLRTSEDLDEVVRICPPFSWHTRCMPAVASSRTWTGCTNPIPAAPKPTQGVLPNLTMRMLCASQAGSSSLRRSLI